MIKRITYRLLGGIGDLLRIGLPRPLLGETLTSANNLNINNKTKKKIPRNTTNRAGDLCLR